MSAIDPARLPGDAVKAAAKATYPFDPYLTADQIQDAREAVGAFLEKLLADDEAMERVGVAYMENADKVAPERFRAALTAAVQEKR